MQTSSVLSRKRLLNALLLRLDDLKDGGFAFSGVTGAASSFATGGEEREPLCCVRVVPGSAIVRALVRRFPALLFTRMVLPNAGHRV